MNARKEINGLEDLRETTPRLRLLREADKPEGRYALLAWEERTSTRYVFRVQSGEGLGLSFFAGSATETEELFERICRCGVAPAQLSEILRDEALRPLFASQPQTFAENGKIPLYKM